jgi:hypothetical protein
VLFLDDAQLREKLLARIDRAWSLSEELRPQLLEAARRQIEIGRAAYKQIYQLVESRRDKQLYPLKNYLTIK